MKRLYARLVLWLIRPALNLRAERQQHHEGQLIQAFRDLAARKLG
ncbi:hypothetical protein SAMN05443026_5841 [Burkholderia orbicola]|nr:hypothetical protein SAMN05443026_5841 [Burkholderia orbicola]